MPIITKTYVNTHTSVSLLFPIHNWRGWLGLAGDGQNKGVCADFAHSDGLVEVKLDDGHLVAGALLAEKAAAVAAATNMQVKTVNHWNHWKPMEQGLLSTLVTRKTHLAISNSRSMISTHFTIFSETSLKGPALKNKEGVVY